MIRQFLLFMTLVCGATSLSAEEYNDFRNTIPRHYTGSFQWKDARKIQSVDWKITALAPIGNGAWSIGGPARFILDQKVAEVFLKGTLFEEGLKIKLREHDPVLHGKGRYITEGHYQGKIWPNYCRLNAVWVEPGSDVHKGFLYLKAERVECDPGKEAF